MSQDIKVPGIFFAISIILGWKLPTNDPTSYGQTYSTAQVLLSGRPVLEYFQDHLGSHLPYDFSMLSTKLWLCCSLFPCSRNKEIKVRAIKKSNLNHR